MRQGLAAAFDRRARGFEFGRFSRMRPCARALARGTKEEASERAVAVRVLRLAERVVARVRVVERERGRRALLRTAVVCVELFELQDGAPLPSRMTANVRGDLTENVRPHFYARRNCSVKLFISAATIIFAPGGEHH